MPFPPQRIGIDDVDQLTHRVLAVADDLGRITAGGRHQPVTDDQHAEVAAGQEFLDHRLAILGGHAVAQFQMLTVDDVDRHALALVAIQRLDHHGQPQLHGRGPGVFGAGDRASPGHGHASGAQQRLGQVLVLGNALGHGTGAVDLGGPDAPLTGTPAELHERALRQATVGDATGHGGVHDRPGGRAQTHILVQFAQRGNHGIDIERILVDAADDRDETFGRLQGIAPDLLFGVLDHHLVGALLHRFGAAGKTDGTTRLRLQGQRHQLEHVGQGNIFLGPAPGLQLRKAGPQFGLETGQVDDGALGGLTVNDGLDGRLACPEVGTAQGPDAGNVHGAMARMKGAELG